MKIKGIISVNKKKRPARANFEDVGEIWELTLRLGLERLLSHK